MALSILTTCKLTPQRGKEISLISHDTGRSERFASLDDLMRAKAYKHPLAAYLIRFFQPKSGFTLETHSESPAGAGISGSSALMIATTAVLARFTGQRLDSSRFASSRRMSRRSSSRCPPAARITTPRCTAA